MELRVGSDIVSIPQLTYYKGPFNGIVESDAIVITDGLDWGKTYRVTVEFITEVLQEPLEVFKDICKHAYV